MSTQMINYNDLKYMYTRFDITPNSDPDNILYRLNYIQNIDSIQNSNEYVPNPKNIHNWFIGRTSNKKNLICQKCEHLFFGRFDKEDTCLLDIHVNNLFIQDLPICDDCYKQLMVYG